MTSSEVLGKVTDCPRAPKMYGSCGSRVWKTTSFGPGCAGT